MVINQKDNTIDLVGLSKNEYRLLKQFVENFTVGERTMSDSDEALAKRLCQKIGAKYAEFDSGIPDYEYLSRALK